MGCPKVELKNGGVEKWQTHALQLIYIMGVREQEREKKRENKDERIKNVFHFVFQ